MRWSCTVTSSRVKWYAGKRTIGVSPPSWRGFEALAPALRTKPARATAATTTPNALQPRISVSRADDGHHPNLAARAVPVGLVEWRRCSYVDADSVSGCTPCPRAAPGEAPHRPGPEGAYRPLAEGPLRSRARRVTSTDPFSG